MVLRSRWHFVQFFFQELHCTVENCSGIESVKPVCNYEEEATHKGASYQVVSTFSGLLCAWKYSLQKTTFASLFIQWETLNWHITLKSDATLNLESNKEIYIFMYISLHLFVDVWESGEKKQEKNWEKLNVLKIVNDFIHSGHFRWFSFSFSDNYLSSLFLCGFFQEVSGITPQYDRLIIMVSFLCLTFHLLLIIIPLKHLFGSGLYIWKTASLSIWNFFCDCQESEHWGIPSVSFFCDLFSSWKSVARSAETVALFIISIHHSCDEGQGCWARVGSAYLCQE